MKARASRPIWFPVACHMLRLNEQLAVMGSTVLLAHGVGGLQFVVREMPCAASDHQLEGNTNCGGRQRWGRKGYAEEL